MWNRGFRVEEIKIGKFELYKNFNNPEYMDDPEKLV